MSRRPYDTSDMPILEPQELKPRLVSGPVVIKPTPANMYTPVPVYAVVADDMAGSSYANSPSMDYRSSSQASMKGTFALARDLMYDTQFGAAKKTTKARKRPGKRKPCNCTRSQCLKLYCECFANGEFCLDCNCKDCHNNLEYNEDRNKAVKQSLERNPHAFKPKIGVAARGQNTDMERLHCKGCHCKKSNCLKNYCECYEAKVACTDRCKCVCCRNTEADRHQRFADFFTAPVSDADRQSPISDAGEEVEPKAINLGIKLWQYMTDDVVEATAACLVAKANEDQSLGVDRITSLKNLCSEFGGAFSSIFNATQTAVLNDMG